MFTQIKCLEIEKERKKKLLQSFFLNLLLNTCAYPPVPITTGLAQLFGKINEPVLRDALISYVQERETQDLTLLKHQSIFEQRNSLPANTFDVKRLQVLRNMYMNFIAQ